MMRLLSHQFLASRESYRCFLEAVSSHAEWLPRRGCYRREVFQLGVGGPLYRCAAVAAGFAAEGPAFPQFRRL